MALAARTRLPAAATLLALACLFTAGWAQNDTSVESSNQTNTSSPETLTTTTTTTTTTAPTTGKAVKINPVTQSAAVPNVEKETGKRKATSKGNELNNYCNADITCDSIPNAKCGDEGRCVCQENYGELNSTFCGHLILHRCDDRVCDAHNSTCNSENICICISRNSKALHPSTNKTYCYPTPNQFGDLCDVHLECRTFLGQQGMCKEGRCSCEERFAPSNNVCKQKKDQLGLECNADTDACFLEKDGFSQYVECRNGTCQCKDGYKPSKDKQSCNSGAIHFVSAVSLLLLFLTKISL